MKLQNKHILTDADGCLVNWNEAFDKFMLSKGYPRIPGTDSDYSIATRHDVSVHTAMAMVKEFNESEHICSLAPFADSVEYIGKLVSHGFSFTVITSISSAPEAAKNRTANLVGIFGDIFSDIMCIEQGASKAATLQAWADTGYFWIEDHMRQAEAGYEVGLKTILIEHPYNTHYKTDLFPTVSYVTPWKEIYHMVCDEYGLTP